jgi:hypothetical protein
MRKLLLRTLFKLFPFDLAGDCSIPEAAGNVRISCVINFFGRLDMLKGILYSLADQRYRRDNFEVVLVEDRGGTQAGKDLAFSFADHLKILYLPLDAYYGKMGYSRNYGLAHTCGEIILFLDDDTVILQHDFLSKLDAFFMEQRNADAVMPHGHAGFSLIQDHYCFHDPYFMTSRCTAYRRKVLHELGGFIDHFVGQEEVEFVTRFTIAGKTALKAEELHYFHPPLLVPDTRKPRAVEFSFFGLKNRYSRLVWQLLANCARHALLWPLPVRRFREQGRFGIGFLCGILDGIRGKKEQVYG